tara:strand:+ start:71 stop:199 length:129 start_codon:yes stop_codon:yes gene_type:complete
MELLSDITPCPIVLFDYSFKLIEARESDILPDKKTQLAIKFY